MKFVRRRPFPGPFADYRRYKRFLRIDFRFQCAYCNVTEGFRRDHEVFGVDHFRPRSLFPALAGQYANLYYCCLRCNSAKGDDFPESAPSFVDPCAVDPFDEHYRELADGRLAGQTPDGRFTIDVLELNRDLCVFFRQRRGLCTDRMRRLRAELASMPENSFLTEFLRDVEDEWQVCFAETQYGR